MWDGIGMRLIGSGSNSQLPIQLNVFEKVNIWANNKANISNIPLIVEGQVEQNLFNRCTFTGADYYKSITNLNSISAVFKRRRNTDGSVDGDHGGGRIHLYNVILAITQYVSHVKEVGTLHSLTVIMKMQDNLLNFQARQQLHLLEVLL